MKSTILGLLAVTVLWAAAQAQTAPSTPSASTNRPAVTVGTNSAARSSFQSRLQNIVTAANGYSKLAAMENRWGAVITRRSTRVGSVSGQGRIDVTCIAFAETRTNQTEYGIRVEVIEGSKPAETSTAYVDHEDIEPLLKGIDSMSRMDMSADPFSDIEAAYMTSGALRVTMTPTGAGKFAVSVQAGRDRTATTKLTIAQLAKFRSLLESAKTKLDSARKDKIR